LVFLKGAKAPLSGFIYPYKVTSYLPQVDRGYKEDIYKHVNDECRPEGIAPITDIPEIDSRYYGAYRFKVGFAEVHQYERDSLYEYAAFIEPLLKTEEEKSAEQELGSQKTGSGGHKEIGETKRFYPVVNL
jgi:hypothetical protein